MKSPFIEFPCLSALFGLGGRRFYDDIPDLRRSLACQFYRFGRGRVCLCDHERR